MSIANLLISSDYDYQLDYQLNQTRGTVIIVISGNFHISNVITHLKCEKHLFEPKTKERF